MKRVYLLVPCIAFLTGCAASFSVDKVTPSDTTTTGFRFSLPKKYVYVEPKADGTVSAKFVYLPDYDASFAIRSESRLQNNALTVTVANGLLTKVSFTQDNVGAVNKLIEQAGALEAERIKADKTAATTAATAAATQRSALVAAFNAADLAFQQAEAELNLLTSKFPSPTAEQAALILAAEIAVEKARIARTIAESRLNGVSDDALANAPTVAYGPAFFEVVETGTTIELEPVTGWHPGTALQLAIDVQPRAGAGTPAPVPECFPGKTFMDLFDVEHSAPADNPDLVTGIKLTWRIDDTPFQATEVKVLHQDQEKVVDTMNASPWLSGPISIDRTADRRVTVVVNDIVGQESCNRDWVMP